MGDNEYFRRNISQFTETVKSSTKTFFKRSGDGIRQLQNERGAEKLGKRVSNILDRSGKKLERNAAAFWNDAGRTLKP